MGLALDNEEHVISLLTLYFHELKKWNRKINLIGRDADDRQIIESHFLDSLTLLPLVRRKTPPKPAGDLPGHLLDVGSGAGFPGLVLKCACSELEVTLLEPRQKRVSFLRHVIRTLALDRVAVVAARLGDETGGLPGMADGFSFITCRALTDLAGFLTMAVPCCSRESLVVCMKGPRGREELRDFLAVESAAAGFFSLRDVREWQLPFSRAVRLLLVFGLDARRQEQ